MERRVEFMILEFVGRVLLNVLKAMVWMALLMFRCVLGLAKLTFIHSFARGNEKGGFSAWQNI